MRWSHPGVTKTSCGCCCKCRTAGPGSCLQLLAASHGGKSKETKGGRREETPGKRFPSGAKREAVLRRSDEMEANGCRAALPRQPPSRADMHPYLFRVNKRPPPPPSRQCTGRDLFYFPLFSAAGLLRLSAASRVLTSLRHQPPLLFLFFTLLIVVVPSALVPFEPPL